MNDTPDADAVEIESIDTPETVLESIRRGEYDAHLAKIRFEVNSREKYVAYVAGHALRVGDRVMMASGRPKYMIGMAGTVKKVLQTYIVMDFDEPCGRFHRNMRMPMTIVKKI